MPYTDGQEPVAPADDQLEFPLAENGIDKNGDILPESAQVGPDDPWPEGMF